MAETTITFLGAAAVHPEAGEESASFLINGTLMVDCGWCGALKMKEYGYSPLDVETLFFTHCHHDHYLGLPALLFARALLHAKVPDRPPLTLVGPPDDLPLVVELSRRFLQADRFPSAWPPLCLHPLEPGAAYETGAFRIDTTRALHGVTGVSGRFLDKRSGAVIAFSGDTGPNPALAELARGADLLIHEASLRPDLPDDRLRGDHSRATDAARIAVEAGVGRLRLLHLHGDHKEASRAAACALFPETELAKEGETLRLAR